MSASVSTNVTSALAAHTAAQTAAARRQRMPVAVTSAPAEGTSATAATNAPTVASALRSNTNLAMGSAQGVNGPALGSPGMDLRSQGIAGPQAQQEDCDSGRDRQREHGAGRGRRRRDLDRLLDRHLDWHGGRS